MRMRPVALALAAAFLLLAGPARAEDAASGGPARWGLAFDAGFPQGGAAGVLFRPVPAVRFWAGPAWNYTGLGLQGGVAVVPWHFALTPVLSAEAGRYFASDMSFLAAESQGVPAEIAPLLEDVSYSYAAIHAGVELGSQSGLAFSLRLGLAYVSLKARGTATVTDSGTGSVVQFTDPSVRGTIPSVKLGVLYWF